MANLALSPPPAPPPKDTVIWPEEHHWFQWSGYCLFFQTELSTEAHKIK